MNRSSPFSDLDDPVRFVRNVAVHISAMHSHLVPIDDLIGCGLVQLVLCGRRFDPARGTRFTTYAWPRITGAMIDMVRAEGRRRRFLQAEELPDSPVEEDVEDQVLKHDLVDHMHRAVAALPERQGQYVRMLLAGHTEVDACRRMEITRGAGRELRTRAFTNLRRRLCVDREQGLAAAA